MRSQRLEPGEDAIGRPFYAEAESGVGSRCSQSLAIFNSLGTVAGEILRGYLFVISNPSSLIPITTARMDYKSGFGWSGASRTLLKLELFRRF